MSVTSTQTKGHYPTRKSGPSLESGLAARFQCKHITQYLVPTPALNHNIQRSDTPRVCEPLMWLPVNKASNALSNVPALCAPTQNRSGGNLRIGPNQILGMAGPDHPEEGRGMGEFYE